MKILCNFTPCGPSYVRSGWKKVFEALGHTFQFWQTDSKPAFDVFSEFEPDVYIGTTYETTRAIAKCIAARPHMKVAMFASAWSDAVDKEIDKQKYPIVVASEQEKRILADLKEKTGKPDFVFIHASGQYLDLTMNGWPSIGITAVGILNAADIYVYYPKPPKPELVCDVGFCGGYWGYKSRNLNTHILPLCHPQSALNVKIFGNQQWPVAQFLGLIQDQNVSHLFSSAKVCPSVSEPHSTDFGFDCIERPFKVMASGGFCVSDYVHEFTTLYKSDEFLMQPDAASFIDAVKYFIRNPEQRDGWIERGCVRTLIEHTYHDRVAQMLNEFGMVTESQRALALKTQRIHEVYDDNIIKKLEEACLA